MNIQLNFQSYPIRVYAMVDAGIALPLLSVIQLKFVIIDINPRKPYATPVTRNLNRPCCLAHSPIRLNFSVYGIVVIPW